MKGAVLITASLIISQAIAYSLRDSSSDSVSEITDNETGSGFDQLVKTLSEKMDNMEASLNSKIDGLQAAIVELRNETNHKEDSLEVEIEAMKSKIEDIKISRTAICGVQDKVNNYDQNITYDKIYIETNDLDGELDAETGHFTAGKQGVYFVTASALAWTSDNGRLMLYLRTSTGRYQEDNEQLFMVQDSYLNDPEFSTVSASRYMYLDEGEEVYLENFCSNETCELWYVKYCVGFYGEQS